MKFWNLLKKLNKLEKCYIILFIASLLAGAVYGLIDKDYFKCCEDIIKIPEEGTSPLKIFTTNYLISLTELVTAGISSFYFNFHTFSIVSSYLTSEGGWVALPFILFISMFELIGSVFLALIGLNFIGNKLLRMRSGLNPRNLFFYGTALIFLGASIEHILITLSV